VIPPAEPTAPARAPAPRSRTVSANEVVIRFTLGTGPGSKRKAVPEGQPVPPQPLGRQTLVT
jgi:hypothetical protein